MYISQTEIYSTWQDALNTLETGLVSARVAKEYLAFLSRFMYSAYLRTVPVILAGPNGEEIARAFSAALFAQSPGVLHCEGSFSGQALDEVTASRSRIVIIVRILSAVNGTITLSA